MGGRRCGWELLRLSLLVKIRAALRAARIITPFVCKQTWPFAAATTDRLAGDSNFVVLAVAHFDHVDTGRGHDKRGLSLRGRGGHGTADGVDDGDAGGLRRADADGAAFGADGGGSVGERLVYALIEHNADLA